MIYEPVSNYDVDLSLLYEDWINNIELYKKTYRSYEHWTREQYGFCLEHAPNGTFIEIHNQKKFFLLLMRT